MRGQFGYDKALDMTLASGEKRDYDPNRMHMICDIYFPELSKPIDDLLNINCKVLDVREDFKRKYDAGMQKDEKMADVYLDKVNMLIEEASKLESQVVSVVKNV